MSRVPISSLILSPPEELLTHFQSPASPIPMMQHMPDNSPAKMGAVATTTGAKGAAGALHPMSPPESPALALHQHREALSASSLLNARVVDPLVIPQITHKSDRALSTALPLFPPIEDPVESAIKRHIETAAVHFMPGKSKGDKRSLRYQMPSEEEYRLAVVFVTTLKRQDPAGYAKRIFGGSADQLQWQRIVPLQAEVAKETNPARRRASDTNSSTRTPKKKKTTTTLTLISTRKATTPRVKTARRGSTTPLQSRSAIPHTRQREPKRPIDENWRALPDFAPPVNLLDTQPKAFNEVDWDGNPLDVSQDADYGELHEAERKLAASLRLSCARYLTCKRRIFVARLEALKINKAFKKTDAQQACQIDVNKASKLWLAFDKLGWFQPQHYTQHLIASS